MATAKKTTTATGTAKSAKPAAPRKPRATKAAPEKETQQHEDIAPAAAVVTRAEVQPVAELNLKDGRYSWAVGRRKTSVANVRLFLGGEKSMVNKKEILAYFGNQGYVDTAFKPLQLTGMEKNVYVLVNVRGGGIHSQSQAVAHAIAQALTKNNSEFRLVLKKNGSLTRDSRMKERKKPGLKGARRGSQWAKR
jgi:small subunit ribosomal protein S9